MRLFNTITQTLIVPIALLLIAGCGGSSSETDTGTTNTPSPETALTADQIENGIGPVTEVNIGPIDEAMAARGEAIFISKCGACHKMADRYVGPPLGDITTRRTPRFIMNMMLNSDQMIKEHPVGKELFATYMTPMPNQNLTEDDARQILEYLRTQVPGAE